MNTLTFDPETKEIFWAIHKYLLLQADEKALCPLFDLLYDFERLLFKIGLEPPGGRQLFFDGSEFQEEDES